MGKLVLVAVDDDVLTVWPVSDDDDDRTVRGAGAGHEHDDATLRPVLDEMFMTGGEEMFSITPRFDDDATFRPGTDERFVITPKSSDEALKSRGVGDSRVVIARGSELAIDRSGRGRAALVPRSRDAVRVVRPDDTVRVTPPDDTVRVVPIDDEVRAVRHDDTRIGPPLAGRARIVPPPPRLKVDSNPERTVHGARLDIWIGPPLPDNARMPPPPLPRLKPDSNPERTVHASQRTRIGPPLPVDARIAPPPPRLKPDSNPERTVHAGEHTRLGVQVAPDASNQRLVPAKPRIPGGAEEHTRIGPPIDPRRTITTGEGDTWPAAPNGELSFRDLDAVGRFTILDTLGTGGMGVVLSAYDSQLDRKVAIKILRPRGLDGSRYAKEAERLLGEARAIAQLSHPHVITVYEAGTIDGRVYVAMEYVSGQTLRAWLAEQPRSVEQILGVLVKAGRGLAAGHRAGLVHRDFKPDNILIGDDGSVRVIDFGLAVPPGPVAHDSDRERESHRLVGPTGTPMYMAPEQHERQALDARTDQFAFCVSLYEALYRRTPFPSASYPLLVHAVVSGEVIVPAPDPRVSQRIVTTVMRGLSANPDRRFASMDALLDELAPPPRSKRNHAAAWMAGVAMVAAVTTLVVVRLADEAPHQLRSSTVTSTVARTSSSASEQLRFAVEAFTAGITAQAKDPKAALASYLRALRILDDIAPDHPYVGQILVGITECRVRLGDAAGAIASGERGLELVSQTRDPVQLARARYALAKALWASNRDRARATQLAEQARHGFASSGEAAASGLSSVDAWLHDPTQ